MVGSYEYDSTSNDTAERRLAILGRAVVHPQFSPDTARYDFMLYLIESVALPHLLPVELNRIDSDPTDGQNVTVVGYGLTSDNYTTSPLLQKVTVAAMNTSVCHELWARHGNPRVHEGSMLCTVSPIQGEAHGPCLGALCVFVQDAELWRRDRQLT
jgi:hypothetical protein